MYEQHGRRAEVVSRQYLCDKGEGCYAQMDRIIEKECPDPARIVFLPYLAGERAPIWDSHAKGAFLGLTFDTNQGAMLRAVGKARHSR